MLSTLFEDFVQSGEVWMNSSLLLNMTKSASQKRKGRHVLLPYWEVKKKFGPANAAQILNDKKEQEQNKSPQDLTVYFMEHRKPVGRKKPGCM